MLFTEVILRYIHPALNIGMADLKSAWLLSSPPVQLKPTVYRGSLVYRIPVSGKRISYRTLKKGLIKKTIVIQQPLSLQPF